MFGIEKLVPEIVSSALKSCIEERMLLENKLCLARCRKVSFFFFFSKGKSLHDIASAMHPIWHITSKVDIIFVVQNATLSSLQLKNKFPSIFVYT